VRQACEEYRVPYNCYPTWQSAFAGHWRELRLLGHPDEPALSAT
jgi:hypothetical protein